jgi:hypothetical protein
MAINTQIPNEEWSGFLTTFSNDTRGRRVSIQVVDPVSGDSGVTGEGKLMGIDYDPVSKGNDIVVSLGESEIEASHTVSAPVELWKAQHDSGEIIALEIIDQNNGKTIVTIEGEPSRSD